MGKVYRPPDRAYGYLVISDAEPRLAEPPAPDEGEVVSVDMAYAEPGRSDMSWKRCQACNTSICRTTEHVTAFVNFYPTEWRPYGSNKRAHFCDRECWARWASRG